MRIRGRIRFNEGEYFDYLNIPDQCIQEIVIAPIRDMLAVHTIGKGMKIDNHPLLIKDTILELSVIEDSIPVPCDPFPAQIGAIVQKHQTNKILENVKNQLLANTNLSWDLKLFGGGTLKDLFLSAIGEAYVKGIEYGRRVKVE